MKRYEAIKSIMPLLSKKDIAVFTTGMISREAFKVNDRGQNFYMIGSMGLAASFALGLALNTDKKVVIFDGDGSLLMEMGNLALIGYKRPANLIHIVLDNESYQSTGGQPTLSDKISLADMAKTAGYLRTLRITTLGYLRKRIRICLNYKGPVFILVKVDKKGIDNIGRVTHEPEFIKRRFENAVIS